mmetsp:Transcript_17782/g.40259  ORF Transcript_17782/g.40259 Transcript_17782/m.40259 type:complete len:83 (-) Transcript_17782:1031-1279(-)
MPTGRHFSTVLATTPQLNRDFCFARDYRRRRRLDEETLCSASEKLPSEDSCLKIACDEVCLSDPLDRHRRIPRAPGGASDES